VSSNTWTPHAVESEARRATRRLWRAVEAQHIASTLRLVANVEEQLVLERLLEKSKPALPTEATGLHYLLATPFRYSSPIGSRFRAPSDSGVWYGAERERTACAELGYWRWRFLMDSDGLDSLGPSPQTVFRAGIDGRMIDLTDPPLQSFACGVDTSSRLRRDPALRAPCTAGQSRCDSLRIGARSRTWRRGSRAAAVLQTAQAFGIARMAAQRAA
jgi:hypothetical protein